MLSIETLNLIQAQRNAHATETYEIARFDHNRPGTLIDRTFANPTLRQIGRVCSRLLRPYTEDLKLPPDAEEYNALFTSETPVARLNDVLSVFIMRNRPIDMGEFVYERIVVTEQPEAKPELLYETPLVVSWGRPGGILAAESPLLHQEDRGFAWQKIVMEVLGELAES